jgi:hypothetical protein
MLLSNIYTHLLGYSRRVQRRNVVLLVTALFLWLVTSATHLHTDNDHDAPGKRSAACHVCLSLPAASAPPTQHVVSLPVQAVSFLIAEPVAPIPVRTVFSPYLSRGPPAV